MAERCREEIGGEAGVFELIAAHEGLDLVKVGTLLEIRWGNFMDLTPQAQAVLRHYTEAVMSAGRRDNAMARLGVNLRRQGFDIPREREARDAELVTLMHNHPFTDAQWVKAREDAYRVLEAEDDHHLETMVFYRMLAPGCGS